MSDEIEIEEHDVLDNPSLKRIFPDLSVIKKEILQYEDLNDIPEETKAFTNDASPPGNQNFGTPPPVCFNYDLDISYETQKIEGTKAHTIHATAEHPVKVENADEQTHISHNTQVHITFQKFLDSLADETLDGIDMNYDTPSAQTLHENDTSFGLTKRRKSEECPTKRSKLFTPINKSELFCPSIKSEFTANNNMLILGSKPNSNHSKKRFKLVIKNVRPFLNECGRFCKHCLILFPNVITFKYHMNKHLNSTRHFQQFKRNKPKNQEIPNTKFQCDICTASLSSKGNLKKHIKNVHKLIKDNKDEIKSSTRMDSINETSCKPGTGQEDITLDNTVSLKDKNAQIFKCFHCPETFDSQNGVIEHLYRLLNVDNNSDTPTKKYELRKNHDRNITETSTCNGAIQRKNRLSNENNFSKQTETPEIHSVQMNAIDQVNDILENLEEESFDSDTDLNRNKQISTGTCSQNTKQMKQVYQCCVCSKYTRYFSEYSKHMKRHNIKQVSEKDLIVFDPQCKICNLKMTTVKSFNSHVTKSHLDGIMKKINTSDVEKSVLQSVLFKCTKCDVFCLSANAALSHSKHEGICDWQCLYCQKLFKVMDSKLHVKQHSSCKDITAYCLSESALGRVLYKCLKCTIHFSEKEYFLHYAKCDLDTPDSVYCNKCDIIINSNDKVFHESHHNEYLNEADLVVIETDIIDIDNEQINIERKISKTRSKFALTFCRTCKCFLGNLGLKRSVHMTGKCGAISPRMCNECGLMVTSKGYLSHEALHRRVKNLSLQHFYFYDIKTRRQMRPPMPDFPKCIACGIHFINKSAKVAHECSRQSYEMCNICNIMLTEQVFKYHMNYHNYKLGSSIFSNKNIGEVLEIENFIMSIKDSDMREEQAYPVFNSSKNNVKCITITDNSAKKDKELPQCSNSSNNGKLTKYLFTCISCHVTVDTYDSLVQHCQDHYDYKKYNDIDRKISVTNNCDEKILSTTIEFDPFYFRFDNDVWKKHVFANLQDEQMQDFIKHSIYKFECRLKMEEIKPGLVGREFYRCDICRCYVDPNVMYSHALNTCTHSHLAKYPCLFCGICFHSQNYQKMHEKIHETPGIDTTTYKIIIFNKPEFKNIYKTMFDSKTKFILYQCRNCYAIVDRFNCKIHQCCYARLMKCTSCGLLLYDKEFDAHSNKHHMILNFKPENMVVVIFGINRNADVQNTKKLLPSFSGTIYDTTVYKCSCCGLCFNSKDVTSDHICRRQGFKRLKVTSNCPKCNLTFLKNELTEHVTKLHCNYLEICNDAAILNIVTFDPSPVIAKESVVEPLKDEENCNDINEKTGTDDVAKLYKCRCGLHFLEESSARKHKKICNPKGKISKQNCFKCSLLFTPGELFNHLLNHHNNKINKFSYIVESI